MSDPVTNVEIEDVLSSIRKLVSDGDKARTRDPAPVAVPNNDASDAEAQTPAPLVLQAVQSVKPAQETPAAADKPEKLLLTPALMIVDAEPAAHEEQHVEADANDVHVEVMPDVDVAVEQDVDAEAEEDFDWSQVENKMSDQDRARVLTSVGGEETESDAVVDGDLNAVEGIVETFDIPSATTDAPADTLDPIADQTGEPAALDRSQLVATIAELEAAVGGNEDDFEPDGSEVSAGPIAWPTSGGAKAEASIEDADIVEADDTTTANPNEQNDDQVVVSDADVLAAIATDVPNEPENTHIEDDTGLEGPAFVHTKAPSVSDEVPTKEPDVYEDDDLDDLLGADTTPHLDDAALRDLVSQVVREELAGPLGERMTRNVRKLVRREIYRILSSQEFD